jgi:predicted RNA-binding protein with PUA-like domain
MAHWLMKSEPDSWSWEQQVLAGEAGTEWTGVRNPVARKHLKAMRSGDAAFFYHTGGQKAVVGIVVVTREYRPDPTDASGRFGMVDVKAVRPLPRPVTLAAVKAEPACKGMALVAYPRLSVQPVTDEEWSVVCRMGGLD